MRLTRFFAAASLIGLAGCQAVPGPLTQAERSSIGSFLTAAVRDIAMMIGESDPQYSTKWYASGPDIRHPAGATFRSTETVYIDDSTYFAGLDSLGIEASDIEVLILGRESALTTNSFSAEQFVSGEPLSSFCGVWTFVWQRRDGEWKVVHDNTNFASPPCPGS